MDLQIAQAAFESAFNDNQQGGEGLNVVSKINGDTLCISARFQDVDAERSFDVVAELLPSEHRSAQQLGQEVGCD